MRTVLKWIGILLGGLLALIAVALIAIYLISEERMNRVYDIAPESVPLAQEALSEDRKFPEVAITFCRECHGQNLAGQVLEDDPLTARLVAPNLTSGKGGVGAKYSDTDWVRAIRHGVGQDGKTLIVMPSNSFYYLSDEDLGYIIDILKDLPPIDKEQPDIRIGPMGRLFILQEPNILPAMVIDHTGPRPPAPDPEISVEYGKYLSIACVDCHGEDFSGGDQVGAGLNLTRGGELADWTEQNFIEALRTGYTPDGEKLDLENMPTRVFGKFSDLEMKALFLYLQSLPPVETSADSQS
jgi:cytochrome c553